MVNLTCFHGTSLDAGQSILRENAFREGTAERLRMGKGAYFFCQTCASPDYPILCAKELERYHYTEDKHTDGYMILSCTIQCEEEQYLDLYDPMNMELFHRMRYQLIEQSLKKDPEFKYPNTAAADTQVFDTIRHLRNLAVIRCPQFFGMFERERQFLFLEGRAYPKTYVPNVIMVCADVETTRIINIEKVDEGKFC